MDGDFVSIMMMVDSESAPDSPAEKECFICRETEKKSHEKLQHFCDCTDLSVHHRCLLAWIQKGSGNENRQQCSACTAKYQLQEGTIWKQLVCQWRNLVVGLLLVAAIIATPISVQYIKTLPDPAPSQLFQIAAVCAGVIAETLLLKCFLCYCCDQYHKAKMSSYSIQARSVEERAGVRHQSPRSPNSSTPVVNRTGSEGQTPGPKDPLSLKLLL
ncbi:uncharacterized protein LOC130275340 isoform X2 [Hyla sarda]|uniref:uncharacterized protein LOC130275340 isoform X2 n=1 Tax=Hyla sarda TaxID=327740 RepID=UPI0024C2DE6D|nr:uncharacterized protein LOC130275340 isoform X2 [Hyla sarda]